MPTDWSAGTLASVLPSVADRLGVQRYAGRDVFDLPAVPRTVVVLVDGLGHDLLRQRSGHAPFLRSHLADRAPRAVRVPLDDRDVDGDLRHGPAAGAARARRDAGARPGTPTGCSTSCRGRTAPTRGAWQPNETVFEAAENAGVSVTMVGPHYFDGLGPHDGGPARRPLPRGALARRPRRRRRGRGARDAPLARLPLLGRGRQGRPRARLPVVAVGRRGRVRRRAPCGSSLRGCRTTPRSSSRPTTAWSTCPSHDRIDLVHEPGLMAGVRHLGGEPRNLQLYTEPGAARRRRGARGRRGSATGRVLTREQLRRRRLVRPGAARGRAPRIGDLVVVMDGVLRRRRTPGSMRPEVVALLGLHGVDERGGARRAGGRGAARRGA